MAKLTPAKKAKRERCVLARKKKSGQTKATKSDYRICTWSVLRK